jgi:hypothetical protein
MMCMSRTIGEYVVEALWHMRYDHLNFRSLTKLNFKDLVHGFPKMNGKKETWFSNGSDKHYMYKIREIKILSSPAS